MPAPLESSVVRIYSKSGKVVGAGFLVSSKYILTCAHVVADALGISRTTQEQPDGVINLDFPLLAVKQMFAAKVIFWQPVNPNQKFEDIAGLELETDLPDTAQPAQLVTSEDLWGHPFRVLGFPAGQPNGVSASGVLRGRIANGWVQVEDVKQPGYRLEPGFSGAPVWDEELQGVAGMAVAAEMNRADVKAAFIIPTGILVSAWSDLGKQAIPSCPYRGLFAFREQDAQFFFGRETFTEQLFAAVQRQQLVAVIGSSGSGKSSVVFAGLVPQLRQQSDWLINSFRPGEHPFRNLAATLVPLLETQMSETDQLVEINKLAMAFGQGHITLQDVVTRILEKNLCPRLLLVADQFEELYTLCKDGAECQLFLDRLLEALNNAPNFRLILTLRADFLGYALSYRPFADALQYADVKLGPMNRQELQDAIEKPAKMLGVRIEEGLTERILEAVEDSPGTLPLLEFALTQLWAKQRNGQLTHDAYDKIGGVDKALATYAEEVYCGLKDEAERQRTQRVFIQLVRPGEGTEDTRRLATRDEVGEENWNLVTRLANARLVVTGRDEATGKETVEVVHEALIREWETLRLWMAGDSSFRTWQERLRAARRQWEATGKDDGALLRGVPLAEAEDWQQKRLAELSSEERVFIQLSLALRDIENKRRDRQRRRIISGLTGGLVLVSILAGTAVWQWQRADIEKINTQLQADSVSSEALLSLNREFDALLTSLRAGIQLKQETKVNYDIRMRVVAALQQAVYGVRERNRLEKHRYSVNSVSFSPDGKTIASASDDKTIKLWSVDGTLLRDFKGHTKRITSISFSPDGKTIASASYDQTIKLWSLDGKEIKSFNARSGIVQGVKFSPDGKYLASAGWDTTIKLWNLDGTLLKTFNGHNRGIRSVSFSPKDKILASASDDGTIKLWNLDDGRLLKTLKGHSFRVTSVSFSPNGQLLASASEDNTLNLWKLDGTLLKTFKGHQSWVDSVSFSPDGKTLASGSWDKTVKLWNLDGSERNTFKGHSNVVRSVNFSPDGKTLASASWDNTVKLWSIDSGNSNAFKGQSNSVTNVSFSPNGKTIAKVSGDDFIVELWNLDSRESKTLQDSDNITSVDFHPDGKVIASASTAIELSRDNQTITTHILKLWSVDGTLLKKFKAHENWIASVSFSPDGKMLASASYDRTIKLWRLDGTWLQTFKGHEDVVNSVRFSPDGKKLASASSDSTVKLWRLDGTLLQTFKGHTGAVTSVSFSPDGKMIASASNDSTVKLWKLDGTLLQTFTGHSNFVTSVSFSPDGKMIASSSDDKTVKLWSIDGTEIKTFKEHISQVLAVSFSLDGKTQVSVSKDNTVVLRNLNLDKLVVGGCNWLHNYLKTHPEVRGKTTLCISKSD